MYFNCTSWILTVNIQIGARVKIGYIAIPKAKAEGKKVLRVRDLSLPVGIRQQNLSPKRYNFNDPPTGLKYT